ncbi:hypothetical protein [Tersicoccus sp. Bi-70]|uniref:hypothetical protein n=1 Tax=Tersicoccus sp. Bi-70 TaxID=1897634 RepID=UPI0009764B29|nr:hypothetical protein [Tersicoccus sp. Bi-70]OMH32979.1 hypothetical protein BGP79_05265 [Tersicoccus sp. Bi-70]
MSRTARRVAISAVVACAGLVATAMPAQAADTGVFDGNPVTCTRNINIGAAEPVIATDGRVVGYSQMRWSDSCQANWIRAWTANGQVTTMQSLIFQNQPTSPNRKYSKSDDWAALHWTMYIRAGVTERMCGSTKIWDTRTQNWAYSANYCRV